MAARCRPRMSRHVMKPVVLLRQLSYLLGDARASLLHKDQLDMVGKGQQGAAGCSSLILLPSNSRKESGWGLL